MQYKSISRFYTPSLKLKLFIIMEPFIGTIQLNKTKYLKL